MLSGRRVANPPRDFIPPHWYDGPDLGATMKRSRNLLFVFLFVSASTAASDARFGVDDMLDVRTVNIGALSDDGKWLAVTSGSLRDRIGIDNHRFGDPTYIAPNHADLMIIETATGKSQTLFADRRQVTGLTWSPGATRLAMLALAGNGFQALIWERATGKIVAVAPPAGKVAAENGELRWMPDGERLLVNLRPVEWRAQAAERFRQETQGIFKIPAFLFHHELENVAPLSALTEAVPGLAVRRNNERRRFLIVKRAQAGIILPGAAQFHGLPDKVDNIDAGFDLINLGHIVGEL